MKRIGLRSFVFAALFCFISTLPVWSQSIVSSTDGFMGNKWGVHVSAVKNIKKVGSYYDKSIQIYQVQGTPDQFAGRWQLLFRNDLFMAAKLRVEGKQLTGLWEQVKNDLGTTFGKPVEAFDKEHYKKYYWDSAKTYAEAEYGSATWVKGLLVSKEVYDQWVAAEKVKDKDRKLVCNYSRFGYGSFSKYCLDRNTVQKLPDRVIRADVFSISLVEDSIASRTTLEFNCSERTLRFMDVVYYKNDQVDDLRKRQSRMQTDANWKPVKPGVYEDVHNFLCK